MPPSQWHWTAYNFSSYPSAGTIFCNYFAVWQYLMQFNGDHDWQDQPSYIFCSNFIDFFVPGSSCSGTYLRYQILILSMYCFASFTLSSVSLENINFYLSNIIIVNAS